jgi:hypothetical protein
MRTPIDGAFLRRLLILFACGTCACASLDDFEIEIIDEAIIDGSYMTAAPNALGFGGDYQGLNISAVKEFADQGIDPDDVDAIFVQSITIVATTPKDARLDPIIESVEFSIHAPGQDTQVLGRAMLADGVEIRQINVVSASDLNLKPFATSQNMSVTADVSLKQTPLFTTSLRTTIKLLIDIDVL